MTDSDELFALMQSCAKPWFLAIRWRVWPRLFGWPSA